MPVRVVLADDHLLVREGIQRILATSPDVEMVGAVSDGDALRDAVEELNPDVIVTDIRMPPSGRDEGLQIAETLRSKYPTTGLLVLSQYADPGYALALFSHGSNGRGYLLKDRLGDGQQLLAAIVGIAAGGSVIDPMVIEDPPVRTFTGRAVAPSHADATRTGDPRGTGLRQEQRRDRTRALHHAALGRTPRQRDLREARTRRGGGYQPARARDAAVPRRPGAAGAHSANGLSSS